MHDWKAVQQDLLCQHLPQGLQCLQGCLGERNRRGHAFFRQRRGTNWHRKDFWQWCDVSFRTRCPPFLTAGVSVRKTSRSIVEGLGGPIEDIRASTPEWATAAKPILPAWKPSRQDRAICCLHARDCAVSPRVSYARWARVARREQQQRLREQKRWMASRDLWRLMFDFFHLRFIEILYLHAACR